MTKRTMLVVCALVLGAGCGTTDEEPVNGEPVPPKVGELEFAAFAPWATPIADYLAVGTQMHPGNFNTHITDLAPHGERLFIGYGDGNVNLGEQIPIEFRFFASPDDPAVQSATIDAAGQGAPQTTPYQSGEEQIDQYELIDGALWQAGVDSIDADELHTQATTNPKGIAGNVYRFDGEVWKKHRSIVGGEHVHALASFQGAVYAVGSGADTRIEFEGGQIFRYLWRTSDLGATFVTVQRIQHPAPGQGDIRWVSMLPTSSALYLFGYQSNFMTGMALIANSVFDGQAVTDLPEGHALHDIYPSDVLPLPDGGALLYGVNVAASPAQPVVLLVSPDGSVQPLATLAGSTVLDAYLSETGEIVYMTMIGEDSDPPPPSYDVRVLVADAATPDTTRELQALTTPVRPASIAYWHGALFLGTGDGQVLRAAAH